MTEAPERIWVTGRIPGGSWTEEPSNHFPGICFVRADLHDALAKERDDLAAELKEMTAVKDIHQNKRYENFERAEKAEAEVERLRRVLSMCRGDSAAISSAALQRKEGNE